MSVPRAWEATALIGTRSPTSLRSVLIFKGTAIDIPNRKSKIVRQNHGWLMFQFGKAFLQTSPKRRRGRTLNSSRFAASPSLALRVSFVGHSLSIEKLASRADKILPASRPDGSPLAYAPFFRPLQLPLSEFHYALSAR
jgi:hypothetical protein